MLLEVFSMIVYCVCVQGAGTYTENAVYPGVANEIDTNTSVHEACNFD